MTRAFASALAFAFLAMPVFAQEAGYKKTETGLQYKDDKVGDGAQAERGKRVSVHYTGWLYEGGKKGKKFDSSVGKAPFPFTIGAREVIPGWDEGVAGMKTGGKRTLIIPPALGYGADGFPGAIPPNATLMFDVELLGVR